MGGTMESNWVQNSEFSCENWTFLMFYFLFFHLWFSFTDSASLLAWGSPPHGDYWNVTKLIMTQIDYVVCFTHLTLLSHGWWKIQYALFSFSIYFYFPLCTPLTWQRRTQFKVVAQIAREANRVRRFAHSFLIWPQTLVDDFFISSSFHFEFFRVSITSAFMQWIFNLLHYFLSLYRDEIELLDSPNCDIWGICGR